MKKLSILSALTSTIIIGFLLVTTNLYAQKNNKIDFSKNLISVSREIIYIFPRDESIMTSNMKDTADFRSKKDLIQEFKNKIFLNGFFVGKVMKGDTVIYRQGNLFRKGKIMIRSGYWEFSSSYSQYGKINYFIPNGIPIDNMEVHTEAQYLYLDGNTIREYKYKIYLNDVFQVEVQEGSSVIYRNGKIELLDREI